MTENRNIYDELQQKICSSEISKEQKLGLSLNLFSVFLSEQKSNDQHQKKFSDLKELLLKQTKHDFSQISLTKLKLFEQATENYRPALCDSSAYGTTNFHYLHQIETLFSNDEYLLGEDGEVIPILWNVAESDCGGITYNEKLTKQFLEFCNTPENKPESYYSLIEKWLEVRGFHLIRSDNTFNYDGLFVLQFHIFKTHGKYFMLLEVHIGADVRGGYSTPFVYEIPDIEDENVSILESTEGIRYYCSECQNETYYYRNEDQREWNKDSKTWICKNKVSVTSKTKNGKVHKQKTLDNEELKDFKYCNHKLEILLN